MTAAGAAIMRMRSLVWIVPCGLLASLAWAQTPPANKKLYCWNDNGQRVCSDALPAEAVGRAREEISVKSGLRTAEVERALSEAERAQAAAEHAQLQIDLAAEETRRRTDQAMLLSYRSEDELRRVFNERITIVDNNIKTARYNVVSLREGLITLLQTAGDRELAGQPVSEAQASAIRARHVALVRQQQLQAGFERQRTELDVEISQILQRYRQMKGLVPGAGETASLDPGSTPAPIKQ